MSNKKRVLAHAYERGYRYCLTFEDGGYITLKTMREVGPFIREQFPREKNYHVRPITESGEEVPVPRGSFLPRRKSDD